MMLICTGNTSLARAHRGDAGLDLIANENVTIKSGEYEIVGTGMRVILPQNTVGLVHPRSGLAGKYGVTVLNAPGTIDQGYFGEIKVILINHGDEDYDVQEGDRIAQLVVVKCEFPEVAHISEEEFERTKTTVEANLKYGRGVEGFGSTGR